MIQECSRLWEIVILLLKEPPRPRQALVSHMCATCNTLPKTEQRAGKGFSRLSLPQFRSQHPTKGWLRNLPLRTPASKATLQPGSKSLK